MRFIIVAAALLFSSLSFSEDYYWRITPFNSQSYYDERYDSPSAACDRYKNVGSTSNQYWYRVKSLKKVNESLWYCEVTQQWGGLGSVAVQNQTVRRYGNSCPESSEYNPETGECVAPLAADGEWCSAPGNTTKTFIMSGGVCVAPTDATLANQCKAYSKSPDSGAAVVTSWKWPSNSSEDLRNPQKAANALGCEIQLLQDISCKTFPPSVDPLTGYASEKTLKCKTNSVLTGNVAPDPNGTPAGSQCEGDECTIEPPAELKEQKPCTYVYDAEGRKTCSSWAFTGKEGAEQCGTVGGVFSCKNDLPKATGKGLSIGTVIDEKPNPDGSKTTTKTDTAKQTVCLANACTTTTTINKTTSIHGADGSLQSTTGTCTGALCASGGKGDADGDGLGDCKGTDCGEEEGGSSAPPAMPELEKEDTYGETTSKFITRIKSAPLVAGISAIGLPEGGSCSIGSAQTWFGSIDFSVFCQLAPQILASLRYLFIAIWAWAAIRLFFTA